MGRGEICLSFRHWVTCAQKHREKDERKKTYAAALLLCMEASFIDKAAIHL